jgi:hypothetical protein
MLLYRFCAEVSLLGKCFRGEGEGETNITVVTISLSCTVLKRAVMEIDEREMFELVVNRLIVEVLVAGRVEASPDDNVDAGDEPLILLAVEAETPVLE